MKTYCLLVLFTLVLVETVERTKDNVDNDHGSDDGDKDPYIQDKDTSKMSCSSCTSCSSKGKNGMDKAKYYICHGTKSDRKPYQLISVSANALPAHINKTHSVNRYRDHFAMDIWTPNDDDLNPEHAGKSMPKFDCACNVISGDLGIVPYDLLTTTTNRLSRTEAAWLSLNFYARAFISEFYVTVQSLPNQFDPTYSNPFVLYPSDDTETAPYRDVSMDQGETDFVAFKLFLAQNQAVKDLPVVIQVEYLYAGKWRFGTHTVVVPIDASLGLYQIQSTNLGSLEVGRSKWFILNFEGLSRLTHFQATVRSTTPGVNVFYPSGRTYTSFYRDDQLDVKELDFLAFRVEVASGVSTYSSVSLQLIVNWIDTLSRSQATTLTLTLTPPVTRATVTRDPQEEPLELVSSEGYVTAGETSYVAVTVKKNIPVQNVQLTLSGDGVVVVHSDDTSSHLSEDWPTAFAAFKVTTSTVGDIVMTLTITFERENGTTGSLILPFTLHARSAEAKVLLDTVVAKSDSDSFVTIPVQSLVPFADEILVDIVEQPGAEIVLSAGKSKGAIGQLSYFVPLAVKVPKLENSTHTFTIQLSYALQGDSKYSKTLKSLQLQVIKSKEVSLADIFQDEELNLFRSNAIGLPVLPITLAVVLGFFALVALVVAVIVVRRQKSKIKPFKPFSDMK